MGIGKEFLKEDKMYSGMDEIVNTIIENMPEIMRIHLMIQKQNAEIDHAREIAHIEIQQIRQTLENLKVATGISKKELSSLQRRKDELIEIRDGNHPIIDTRTGEPLRMTQLVYIVVNYPMMINQVEKIYNRIGKVKNTIIDWAICKPVKRIIKFVLTKTDNKEMTSVLMELYGKMEV